MQRSRLRRWVITGGFACLLPLRAAAQPTTEQGASLLFFPKVVADGTSDTLIQINNVSRNTRHAHCFYVNGAPANPSAPVGPQNPPLWTVIDFPLSLTGRQPTHWVVSRGRPIDPTDTACNAHNLDCDGAGYDPGTIPATPAGFRGEALCLEVDASGFPVPGNALVGKATLQQLSSGDIASYNAIGLHGEDTNNEDSVLCLGGGLTPDCPSGAEYAACPQAWLLNQPTDGNEDAVGGAGSSVTTDIVVAPCAQDLAAKAPTTVTLQFHIINELEQQFSASTTVTCWADIPLATISPVFESATLGAAYAQTRITSADPNPGGVVVLAQTMRAAGGISTATGLNLHVDGAQSTTDRIVIPATP